MQTKILDQPAQGQKIFHKKRVVGLQQNKREQTQTKIMSNPFPAHFDSTCDWCGDPIDEGDTTYAVDGSFHCEQCARDGNNVCDCDNFKKEEYETCFDCKN